MFLTDVFIIENLQILEEASSDKPMKVRGIFQRAEEANNNKRVYPKTVLENQMGKLQPLIEGRRLCGELDHPSNDTVKLSNASHLITKLEMKGNEVLGEAEILNTPAGLTAKALIKGGVQIGISSRGMGTLSESADGTKKVNEDFKLVTFDLVADPSTRGAYPSLSESTQYQEILKKSTEERVFIMQLQEEIEKVLRVDEKSSRSAKRRRKQRKKKEARKKAEAARKPTEKQSGPSDEQLLDPKWREENRPKQDRMPEPGSKDDPVTAAEREFIAKPDKKEPVAGSKNPGIKRRAFNIATKGAETFVRAPVKKLTGAIANLTARAARSTGATGVKGATAGPAITAKVETPRRSPIVSRRSGGTDRRGSGRGGGRREDDSAPGEERDEKKKEERLAASTQVTLFGNRLHESIKNIR